MVDLEQQRRRRRYDLSLACLALLCSACVVTFDDWQNAGSTTAGGASASAGSGTMATGAGAPTSIGGSANGGTTTFGGAIAGGVSTGGVSTGGVSTGGKGTGGVSTGGVSTGGVSTGGVSTGGVSTGGTSTGGTSTGGTSTGGTSTGGTSTGGTSTGGATETVKWLSLARDRAPSNMEPNTSLGIEGRFHITKDPCASATFNPDTRCISGTLCDATSNWDDWGVALLFDFYYSLPTASPANATYRWDPTAHAAIGVTWRISATAVANLQLWVLNMDPQWGSYCTASTCELVLPPDGAPSAAASGTLYFNNMKKDVWGSSSSSYVYDPAATISLQFKLPAIMAGVGSYQFCLDQLGVVVRP